MRSLFHLFSRFAADQRGVALVETALATPFLLLLSSGVFEFSNILHTRLLIEAGVEDAARYIARCSDDTATCETRAINLAVNGDVTGGTARVTGLTTANVSVAYHLFPTSDENGVAQYRSNAATVEVAEVTATFTYAGTGLWGYLGFGAIDLTFSHEERIMGW
jgi:Flp pilus assembly protein TadG